MAEWIRVQGAEPQDDDYRVRITESHACVRGDGGSVVDWRQPISPRLQRR
jgi:hypothetical protein